MKVLEIVYILAIIVSYVKLILENKIGRIGIMTIIILTLYYLFFSLVILVFNFLELYFIYNLIIKFGIMIISVWMLFFSLISIIVAKKFNYLIKYILIDVINIVFYICILITIILV